MNTLSLKSKLAYAATSAAVLSALAVSGTAFAATSTTATPPTGTSTHRMGQMPGVFGTVASINGTTLTITSKGWPMGPKPASGSTATPPAAAVTTYTVDASAAKVMKAGTAATLSSVAVGDTVMIQGTVSGTNVTATVVNDGMDPRMGKAFTGGQKPTGAIVQGNGQPVVGGTITALSGNTISITNKSNVSYSVDASGAFIDKGNATSTISSLAVGDNVVVQGAVSGSNVTASSVVDSGAPKTATSGTSTTPGMGGVMSAIGGFFQHLFGFF